MMENIIFFKNLIKSQHTTIMSIDLGSLFILSYKYNCTSQIEKFLFFSFIVLIKYIKPQCLKYINICAGILNYSSSNKCAIEKHILYTAKYYWKLQHINLYVSNKSRYQYLEA